MNVQLLFAWLKQPSTLKALMVIAGYIGYKIDPSKVQEIIEACLALYVGIQAFYNQQPAKPPVQPSPPEATPLTEERFRELLAEARNKKTTAPQGEAHAPAP